MLLGWARARPVIRGGHPEGLGEHDVARGVEDGFRQDDEDMANSPVYSFYVGNSFHYREFEK